jgi:putative ABC transport system permease protein
MPNWKHIVRQQLAALRLPPQRENEIVEEVALHLEAAYDDARAEGLSETEAATRVVQSYDWRLLECELSRVERRPSLELLERTGGNRMNSFLQDLRFGARMLMKQPGFTLIAVITLALGIGANTAMFSVVNAVLLRPLPYAQAGGLVVLWGNFSKLNIARLPAKAAEYLDYRDQTNSFAQVAASHSTDYNLTGAAQPERLKGAEVTANLFSLLGAALAQGRGFTPEDEQPGRNQVVIISHAFWQQRLGGAANVVGRVLRLNEQSYTIVGVMADGFQYPHASFPFGEAAELWTPLAFTPEQIAQRERPYYLNVLARLRPGVTAATAQAELDALGERFKTQHRSYTGPNGWDGGWRITVTPLLEEVVGSSRRALWLLLGAIALVLLIACANVANLLLTSATTRQRELAIRAALGASRFTLARQMLSESLWLAGLGALGGWLLARWSVAALAQLKLDKLPRLAETNLDGRVLTFTVALTLLTCVLCSLFPVWQASRANVQQTLKGGSAAVTHRRPWLRQLLVVSEVALAVLLLTGAGLLLNSLIRVQRLKPGLDVNKLLIVELSLSAERYPNSARIKAFTRELLPRLAALPGAEQAGAGSHIPLSDEVTNDPLMIEGRPLDPKAPPSAGWQMITPAYFRTVGMRLLRGREFTAQDGDDVAIINETMARKFWPHEDALGQRLSLGLPRPDNPYKTVVGIVADTPQRTLESPAGADWYLPFASRAPQGLNVFIRTAGEPAALAAAVRQQVWALDQNQPVAQVSTLRERVAGTLTPRRFNTGLLGGFAALALVLAALGIASVLAFSVTERTHEIGVRQALGAQSRDVLTLVIRQGLTLVIIGAALGLAGALALTRLLKSLLFGVTATDPLTFVVVTVLLFAVALLACWIPARRATQVDPLIALRHE